VIASALIVSLALLLLNGFFVAASIGLLAARPTRLEELVAQGEPRAKTALSSTRELSVMLAGAQLGITMCSLGLGFAAEPAVARLIAGPLGATELPDGFVHSISFAVGLAIVVFFHMVFGEMAPKNVAISEPERTALWLALPMRIYVTVFRPLIYVLNFVAKAGLKLMGIEARDDLASVHTAEEIGAMIAEAGKEGVLEEFKQRLLSGAIELGTRDAGAAMIPRTEIEAVSVTARPAEIERKGVETGHSRLPVYAGDLDHVLGFVHAKDLLRVGPEERERPLPRRLIRQMLIVPESRKLRPLLIDMRRERRHLALVIDEHGGTAGIVTLEDLLEELVGEIRDEYDVRELGVERLDSRRFVVPGSLRIDEASTRLGVDLPEGEYETVAGFLMDRLGRIPKRRDSVEHDGWRLRVRNMNRRRVVQVLIEPAAKTGASSAARTGGGDG
jgi:CBS domain containing-hemolysin-like protein